MSAAIELMPLEQRIRILSGRLESLRAGKGDYSRPEDRTRAINNCARWLEEVKGGNSMTLDLAGRG